MSASPEFYKPAPVFSPCRSPLVLRGAGEEGAGVWEENCRTPTCGESHLKAPVSCPPAPRKPRAPAAPCRKRLFEVEVFSLRLDELERLFWPQTPPPEKRRRVA